MKLAMVSDLHGKLLPDAEPCDVLIIAGDICPDNQFTLRDRLKCATIQASWFSQEFIPYLKRQLYSARYVLFIWGNHDFLGEFPELLPALPTGVVLLHDSSIVLDGVRFSGTPWVSVPGNRWALDRPEAMNSQAYELLNMTTDVLITHGPPKMILDSVAGGEHVGSSSLRRERDLILPQIHVFGHIHEARGVKSVTGGACYNVSAVTETYQPRPDPIMYTEVYL